jgi:hypothetical protein
MDMLGVGSCNISNHQYYRAVTMPLGWIGNALIICGHWLLGKKLRLAFLLSVGGGCCWILEGIRIGKSDLVFIEVALGCIAIRNFWKWREK